MADDRGFYGEHDPEWAIARLAAHAAEAERDRRSAPWLVLGGALVTTALVVVAFVLGFTENGDPTGPTAQPAPTITATVTSPALVMLVAPRATLRPKPVPEVTQAPEPVAEVPDPVIVQAVQPDPEPVEPSEQTEQSKQVGPNRPITRPVDPDDRR